MKLPKLKDLMYGNLDAKVTNRNWGNLRGDNMEEYQVYEAEKCYECGEIIVMNGYGNEKHCDIDKNTDCSGYLNSEGPMMDHSYDLSFHEISIEEAARRIVNLPLCIVEFSDEKDYSLALTGGGMDLSWEICEAYIRLGQLPPTHFANLPGMSGMGESKKDKLIIAACKKSLRTKSKICLNAVKNLSERYSNQKKWRKYKS